MGDIGEDMHDEGAEVGEEVPKARVLEGGSTSSSDTVIELIVLFREELQREHFHFLGWLLYRR
jgi:hypothetical protein